MPIKNEALDLILDEIVKDRTFSVEAVEGIQQLREDNKTLQAAARDDEVKIAEQKNDIEMQGRRIENLMAEVNEWKKRENNLLNREEKMTTLEKNEAVAKAVTEALGHCFDTVFNNTVFRESFNKCVPGGEYGGTESGEKTTTTGAE